MKLTIIESLPYLQNLTPVLKGLWLSQTITTVSTASPEICTTTVRLPFLTAN
ncbi:MAG: hypothetical protein KME45_09445 [Stenomitos rutilans HA7619-LM2]|nr:hypothetical protein [Stenomitos rutilans HA7619-LM2]